MGLIDISSAEFDPNTMVLNFDAKLVLGSCRLTVVSSIRLHARPRTAGAVRWAIMQRASMLLA
jgi:hypothetical protein